MSCHSRPRDPNSALITASRAAEQRGKLSAGRAFEAQCTRASGVKTRSPVRRVARERALHPRNLADIDAEAEATSALSAGVAIRGVTGFDPIVGLGPTARPVGQIVERRRRLRRARPDHRTAVPTASTRPARAASSSPEPDRAANRRPRSGPGSRSATATPAGADARRRAAPARVGPKPGGTGRPCSSLPGRRTRSPRYLGAHRVQDRARRAAARTEIGIHVHRGGRVSPVDALHLATRGGCASGPARPRRSRDPR